MSLYQKYRPSNFADITGQKHVSMTLKNALSHDLVAHAYLFCGPRGTGKTTAARILSKAINCLKLSKKSSEPCKKCTACLQIQENSVMDVVEIDAASNRGIDEIRLLKENVGFAPTQVKNKIYIIDEVHMLTKEAFNALLKTLEEPPANVYFILATTELHKIPETIISRCQKFNFERLAVADIVKRLEFICAQEKLKFQASALEQIAEYSNGGMRDSISILDQVQAVGEITTEKLSEILGKMDAATLESFVQNLIDAKSGECLATIQEVHTSGSSLVQFASDMVELLRKKMHEQLATNPGLARQIASFISDFYELKQNFFDSSVMKITLEVFVVQSCIKSEAGYLPVQQPAHAAVPKQSPGQLVKPVAAKLSKGQTKESNAAIDKLLKEFAELKTQLKSVSEQNQELKNQSQQNTQDLSNLEDQLSQVKTQQTQPQNIQAAAKATPMLDEALEILKENENSKQDSKKSKIYADEFSLSELEPVFANCAKSVKTPTIKRALKQASLSQIDKQTLGINFSSQFLIKTIDKPELIEEIEKTIAKEFKLIKVKIGMGKKSKGSQSSKLKSKKAKGLKKDPLALDPQEESLRQSVQAPDPKNDLELADFFEGEIEN